MSKAQKLKSQATQIKRAVTGMRSILAYTEGQRLYADINLLSNADKKALEKAIVILNQVCSKTSGMSAKAATQERAKELALKKATDEAIKLFNQWPKAVTTLDKVALIFGTYFKRNLLEDIERDQLRLENQTWAKDLNYWFEEAHREVPQEIARRAVSDNKPVAELMLVVASRLAEIKKRREVELVAARWQVKLDQEASGACK